MPVNSSYLEPDLFEAMKFVELEFGKRYIGDCFEIIPHLQNRRYDLLLTDPPYATPSTYYPHKTSKKRWSDLMIMKNWFSRFLDIAHPKLVENGCLAVFCDAVSSAAFTPAIYEHFDQVKHVVWDKEAIGLGKPIRTQHELVVMGVYRKSYRRDGSLSSVIGSKRITPPKRRHPAEKPIDILAEIIDRHCPPGGLVLDPFAGSGSTYEAAVKCGRQCDLFACRENSGHNTMVGINRIIAGSVGKRLDYRRLTS